MNIQCAYSKNTLILMWAGGAGAPSAFSQESKYLMYFTQAMYINTCLCTKTICLSK